MTFSALSVAQSQMSFGAMRAQALYQQQAQPRGAPQAPLQIAAPSHQEQGTRPALVNGTSAEITPITQSLAIDPLPPSRIQPIVPRTNPSLTQGGHGANNFWHMTSTGGPDPTNHIAPPSVTQIRIAQLLDAQANKLEQKTEEAIDRALAEIETDVKEVETQERDESENSEENPKKAQVLSLSAYAEAKRIARGIVMSTFP